MGGSDTLTAENMFASSRGRELKSALGRRCAACGVFAPSRGRELKF